MTNNNDNANDESESEPYLDEDTHETDDAEPSQESTDSGSEEMSESDKLVATRVSLSRGAWVVVKVYGQTKQSVNRKKKTVAITAEYMHLAQLQEVEDDTYTVSFLKCQADGSYVWPKREDQSSVHKFDVVKLSHPKEDIVSGASNTVIVKLTFVKNNISAAKIALKVPPNNVC